MVLLNYSFHSIYEKERRYMLRYWPIAHNRPKDTRKATNSAPDALHASSTVNANDLSVYPVTIFGGKEADDAGNVHWLADTVVW